jgi:hypothetical protein
MKPLPSLTSVTIVSTFVTMRWIVSRVLVDEVADRAQRAARDACPSRTVSAAIAARRGDPDRSGSSCPPSTVESCDADAEALAQRDLLVEREHHRDAPRQLGATGS